MRALLCVFLVACGGVVASAPPDERAYYTDPTCAARPAALSGRTVEPGWHYDGSDPKVRVFDTTLPSPARRVCWRAEGPEPCPCRELDPWELCFEVQK